MNRAAPALALALTFLAGAAHSAPVEPGARVRVTILERAPADSLLLPAGIDSGDRIKGTLLSAGPHGLGLAVGDDPGDTLTIARELVADFEASAGKRSRTGRGAMIGLLSGIVGGFAFAEYFTSSEGVSRDSEKLAFRFGFVTVGGLGGLGLGALVGSICRTERWRRAPLP